ncbi:MAG TPA: hypothetical protein VEG39_12955 [Clostridia bacterium]|nr:hypothetical protein [Clostridia bacterium]
MKLRRKSLIIIVISVTVLILLEYALSPYIDAYRINKHLDISGVKMLMAPSQVEEILGKGSPIGGFGAEFYGYDNSAVVIAYPWEGLLEGKVGYIDVSGPKYSICGVRPGDSSDKAKKILKGYGFIQDKKHKDTFRRGSARIYILWESVRVDIEDWSIKGHVY